MTVAAPSAGNAVYATANGDTVFREKVLARMIAMAHQIAAEPRGALSLAAFQKRHGLVGQVLGLSTGGSSGAPLVTTFAISIQIIATPVTVADNEAAIDTAISSVWNNIANISAAD